MIAIRTWVLFLFVGIGTLFSFAAMAQIGTVVALTQPAEVQKGDNRNLLSVGDTVMTGDVVSTGTNGRVQLQFPDETRIVVGPKSQLKIQKLLFRKDNTARRFRLRAVSGTFRMLTGNSPKRAYSVRTPTGSMAVRGTEFDFHIPNNKRETTLVVHEGAVNLCGAGGRCVVVPNGCRMVGVNQALRFAQPKTLADRNSFLERAFPFAFDDTVLAPAFRASQLNCRDDDKKVTAQTPASEILLPQLALPKPPDPSSTDKKPRSGNPAE